MPTTKTTKTANEKHRQTFEQLRELLADPKTSLEWHHNAGKLVLRLLPKRTKKEQYGDARAFELRDRLGLPKHRERLLYAVREFADQYNPKDLAKLNGLSWSHVYYLLGVENRHQRDKLANRCLSKELSCRDLLQLIYEQRPLHPTGGRRPPDPKLLGHKWALKETARLSRQWVQLCGFWLDEITPILKKAASPRKPDLELVELMSKAESDLATLHKEVGKRRKALRKLKPKAR